METDFAFTKETTMRSFCFILLSCMCMTAASLAMAQDDDKTGSNGTDSENVFENKKAPEETAPAPAAAGGETIMDAETAQPLSDANGDLINANFLSIGGTAAWIERNGLGVHASLGGYTCMREYCDTTLDASIMGSIAFTGGAYYRITPNVSLTGDITIAHLNTNARQLVDIDGDDRGVAFQLILGGAFHLPVKGWLDLYTNLGIGPILLREKTSTDLAHHWGGFDIEWGFGANFYFWSVGPLKNFSLGPYMKFGFPIWARVCEINNQEICDKPSAMDDSDSTTYFWSETPFTYQIGIEARLDFSLGAKKEKPVADVSMEMEPAEDASKTDAKSKTDDSKDTDKDKADAKSESKDDGDKAEADAEGSANWDI